MSDYNGWTNYETWCVNLWLGNDELSYHEVEWLAMHARDRADDTKDELHARTAEGLLADALKAMVSEEAPDLGASMFADLLNSALGEVNWYEIANAWLIEN